MFKWIKDKLSNEEENSEKQDHEEDRSQPVEEDLESGQVFDERDLADKDLEKVQAESKVLDDQKSSQDQGLVRPDKVEEIEDHDKDQVSEDQNKDLDRQEPSQDHPKESFFARVFSGLEKTRKDISDKLGAVLGSYLVIDDELYEDLEDILISADIGVETTIDLIDNVKENIKENKITSPNEVTNVLKEETRKMLDKAEISKFDPYKSPTVILVVGVNGVGKTTTVAKLAARYKDEGHKVMLVAADTFRAAATDQLKEWASRIGVDIVSQDEGADPAAVVYDAIQSAKAKKTDIILVDTAGRLHNKANLMNELEKIFKTIEKNFPEANRESLIVLDATTGQNAINQARQFNEVTDISAIAITKLDGTAKGGMVLAIINELGLPISYIGVGEKVEDLQEFDSEAFVESIFE